MPGTKGPPAAAEMLATSGTCSPAGAQATAMTQATTATPRAAETLPETVPTPTPQQLMSFCRNSRKTRQNAKFRETIQRKRVKIALFCPIGFMCQKIRYLCIFASSFRKKKF
jgi:hypothetical protein